jgi:hypothetical protein
VTDQEYLDALSGVIRDQQSDALALTQLAEKLLAHGATLRDVSTRLSELAARPPCPPTEPPDDELVPTTEQFSYTPADGETIDLAGKLYQGLSGALWKLGEPAPSNWPSHSAAEDAGKPASSQRFPVTITGSANGFAVTNLTTQHLMHDQAPWHIWKGMADSDGIRVEGGGPFWMRHCRIDNVTDGLNPRRGGSGAGFRIEDCYLSRIHDDCLENDDVLPGYIGRSFLQGHTFYSARPSSGAPASSAVVTIEDCVVELLLQPFQGGSDSDDMNHDGGYPYDDGLGCGTLWKMEWDGSGAGARHPASGSVVVRNTVFLVPRQSSSSMKAMRFARGTYDDCTLVWLGDGAWPWPLPDGIRLTRDRSVFDERKAAFFQHHPQFRENEL